MTDRLGKLLDAFVTHVPRQIVAATAVLLYAGGGPALPLALQWRTQHLVEANVVGTVMAAAVARAWFVVQTCRSPSADTAWLSAVSEVRD